MVYSVQQIKYEILAYMKEFGGDFSDYYVGITHDPENALFKNHRVDSKKDPWLYKQALTFQAARSAQDYFLYPNRDFVLVCQLAGFDHEYVRMKVRKKFQCLE